jgi:stress-induced morphogen
MPMPATLIEARLKGAFPDAAIDLNDLAGDENHYELTITSEAFRGKTMLAQHRLVQAALPELMDGTLHALAISTKTP